MSKLSFLLLILLSITRFSFSQSNNQSVSGTVQTADREMLSGATVTISQENTTYSTVTNENGFFSFMLPTGRYTLTVTYAGFSDYTQQVALTEKPQALHIELQRQDGGLREVVVSTQRRLQRRIEVPVAVSAVSGATLDKLNVRQYDELALYIPGLQMQLQSPNNPSYVIRGITSDDGDTRLQQRVSIFRDGVAMSRSRGSVSELFDMERVEVMKGPQGTLFGRGAQIGAVHLIQNKPVNYLTGELSLGYGNYNQKIANGFINTPLGDKWANRFAFYYNERDGFIKNTAGGDLNGRNVIALRDIIRFQPSASTTADLIVNYQHDNYPGVSFKSKQYAPPGGDTLFWTDAGLEQGKNLYIKRDVVDLNLTVHHHLSDRWGLTSITGYRHYNSDESFDADGTVAPVLWLSEIAKGDQFSQEFRFNYDDKKRFSGFVGASFFHDNASTDVPLRTNEQSLYVAATPLIAAGVSQQLLNAGFTSEQVAGLIPMIFPSQPVVTNGQPNYVTNLPDIAGILEAAGVPVSSLPADVQQLVALVSNAPLNTYHEEWSHDYGENTAYEIFGDGTYKVTPRLSVTAGLRGSYEKQTGGYRADASEQPGALGILMGLYPNLLWQVTDGKLSVSKDYFSYVGRFAVNYLFGKNNVYASISRGRRPGVIMVTATDTSFLQPEIVWSYETGLKGQVWQNKLGYDLAVYYYDWSHFQSSAYELQNGSLTYVSRDAGKAHSFGWEASVQYAFVKNSTFFANWAYIDGKFNKEDEQGNKQEYAGNTFRLTPKNTFTTGVDVNLPLHNNKATVYLRPTYAYKSKIYFDNSNRQDLSQDAVSIVNATGGVRWRSGKMNYDISLFGKNIFDEKYLIDAGNSGDAIGMPTYVAGNRRTYGVILKMGF